MIFRDTFAWWTAILGGLLAAPSVISIVQRELSLGLAPAFERIVAFYRGVIHSLLDVIAFRSWPLVRDLSVDQFNSLADAVPIALVVMGVGLRMNRTIDRTWGAFASALATGVPLLWAAAYHEASMTWALVIPVAVGMGMAMFALVLWPNSRAVSIAMFRYSAVALTTCAATAAAVVAFYVGNQLAL